METTKIAKNLLLDLTCYKCSYLSTVYRMKTTHVKKQCTYLYHRNRPLPQKLTCKDWRKA